MRRYLSYGGGVNSTALMLLLRDEGIDFEAVYADHGADWPETREYVDMLIRQGWPITVLQTRRDGLPLYDYYESYSMMPFRMMRHCTTHFKVLPLQAYIQPPCIQYIGYSADEAHRAQRFIEAEGIETEFPLIERGIGRQGCKDLISTHGLPVPMKSGCFICPFQRPSQWRELQTKHPDLMCKARALEAKTNAKRAEKGKTMVYLSGDRPVDQVAESDQMDLFGERGVHPCLCEL